MLTNAVLSVWGASSGLKRLYYMYLTAQHLSLFVVLGLSVFFSYGGNSFKIGNNCPLGLKDELIRLWWSKVWVHFFWP